MIDTAKAAVALAQKKGAQESAATAGRERSVEVQWRDGAVEKISEATTRRVTLELYVDGRYSVVSTADLRPEALERFIADAVELTRKLGEDKFRGLPDPALYAGQSAADLQLVDAAYGAGDPAQRRRLTKQIEEAARAQKGAEHILSVTTGAWDTLAETWRVASNGFEGSRSSTSFGLSGAVSVKDPDGRRPEDAFYASARHQGALPDAAAVGAEASRRALSRLGSKKGDSAVLTMAVENRAAGRLVSFLFGGLAGAALQQKRSFLEGKQGALVGSKLLDLRDDPLVPRGLGSRLWDSEGLAAKRFPVFEQGVLRSYYIDTYYGRKLGLAPTTRGPSNLAWQLGSKDRDGLVAGLADGILVTGFLGGNSNGTTGDFSLGTQGFRVRGGKLAEPVSEMNVSGNHLELWKRLVAVGNDPYAYSAMRTPTLVFEGVQFAGV